MDFTLVDVVGPGAFEAARQQALNQMLQSIRDAKHNNDIYFSQVPIASGDTSNCWYVKELTPYDMDPTTYTIADNVYQKNGGESWNFVLTGSNATATTIVNAVQVGTDNIYTIFGVENVGPDDLVTTKITFEGGIAKGGPVFIEGITGTMKAKGFFSAYDKGPLNPPTPICMTFKPLSTPTIKIYSKEARTKVQGGEAIKLSGYYAKPMAQYKD